MSSDRRLLFDTNVVFGAALFAVSNPPRRSRWHKTLVQS
jgi:hypothetical protein